MAHEFLSVNIILDHLAALPPCFCQIISLGLSEWSSLFNPSSAKGTKVWDVQSKLKAIMYWFKWAIYYTTFLELQDMQKIHCWYSSRLFQNHLESRTSKNSSKPFLRKPLKPLDVVRILECQRGDWNLDMPHAVANQSKWRSIKILSL